VISFHAADGDQKLTHSVAITPLTVSVFPLQIDVSSL